MLTNGLQEGLAADSKIGYGLTSLKYLMFSGNTFIEAQWLLSMPLVQLGH